MILFQSAMRTLQIQMRTHSFIGTAMLISLLVFSMASFGQTPTIMTDATVVQMVQQKIAPDLIILAISKCTPQFALDPSNSQYMTQMGVTDEIFKAMAARQMGPATPIPTPSQLFVANPTTPPAPSQLFAGSNTNKPRVFMQSLSHGNTWNARRDQSMELSKDFERDCTDVRITLNQSNADYTINLNHIEIGLFLRDNQFQIADKNGDLLAKTKEGGSIRNGAKKACAMILADWANKQH
jgi:hypothetical protein